MKKYKCNFCGRLLGAPKGHVCGKNYRKRRLSFITTETMGKENKQEQGLVEDAITSLIEDVRAWQTSWSTYDKSPSGKVRPNGLNDFVTKLSQKYKVVLNEQDKPIEINYNGSFVTIYPQDAGDVFQITNSGPTHLVLTSSKRHYMLTVDQFKSLLKEGVWEELPEVTDKKDAFTPNNEEAVTNHFSHITAIDRDILMREFDNPKLVTPKYVMQKMRLAKLANAIHYCCVSGNKIQPEWVDEYNELIEDTKLETACGSSD